MSYPEKWEVKENENMLAFLSPTENENDIFQENVNLIIQDLSAQPMTLDEFTKLSQDQLKQYLAKAPVTKLTHTTLVGQKADQLEYSAEYQGFKLKLRQYWFIKDNKAYVFTYTANEATFQQYLAPADQIIKSFKFIK